MTPIEFCQLLAIDHPIIKAPMAGGADSPALVAAASEAGGMGFIGGAYLNPQQLAADCAAVRALTRKPFGVNLFAPELVPERPTYTDTAIQALSPFHTAMDIPPPHLEGHQGHSFEQQLETVLNSEASVLSFTFGRLPDAAMQTIRKAGITLIGTATSTEEARLLEHSGVDAIVVQGSEAGGHRGGFSNNTPMIGTLALVSQASAAVKVPVIAAGGIMNGQGVRAALQLGACAAQLGTAFLTCPEATIPDSYKQAILSSKAEQTRLTRAFSGRYARGITNRVMDILDAQPDAILPFPWQNNLTRPLRSAGAQADNANYLSLWAGQGLEQARQLSASQLMAALIEELRETKKQSPLVAIGQTPHGH